MNMMKEYDGPAFHRKKNPIETLKFKQASQSDIGQFRFEPAYKDAKRKNPLSAQQQYQRVSGVQTDQPATEPALNIDNYQVPFLNKQQQAKLLANIQEKQNHLPEEGIKDKTQRDEYQPSLLTKKQQDEESKFRSAEIPKPQKPNINNKEIDRNTRKLAKRLIKTKESFLLFDKSGGSNLNDKQK